MSEDGDTKFGSPPIDWNTAELLTMIDPTSSITYGVVQPGPEISDGVKFIRGGDIFGGKIATHRLRTISQPVSDAYRRTLLKGGELLMSLVGYPGEVAIVPEELAGANIARQAALLRIDKRYDANYVMYFLLSELGKKRIFEQSNGSAQQVVNLADLRHVRVDLPPLSQQRKIGKILTTVDNLIEKTKALIAKYQAIQRGLMFDLLTCGLDEHGHLRDPIVHPEQFQDSPFGRIPRAWETARLGACSLFVTSGSRGWAAHYSKDGPVFLRIGNLTREHINLRFDDVVRVRPPAGSEGARTRVEAGDILISITADLGIIGVIPDHFDEAYVNQHIALVRPGQRIVSRWLGRFLAFGSAAKQFQMLNDTGAKAGMNLPAVESVLVAVPSREKQLAASSALDAIDEDIDGQFHFAGKLRWVKSGLMSDLLTGRVCVPELEDGRRCG